MEIPALFYPAVGALVLTIVGWALMLYLNSRVKDLTDCINFDASSKLLELKICILPKLKQTLWEAEGQKLMEAAKKRHSAVDNLDFKIKVLKFALYEAEDTLDLLEYHRLKINARELHGSWFRSVAVQTLRSFCRFLHLNDRWFYDAVDTIYQEDNTAADSFLSTISRCGFIAKWKLKSRIENMENISKVHKSSSVFTSAQTDITNKVIYIRSDGRPKVFGRDTERDDIIKKLYEGLDGDATSSSSSTCHSVIGIHGIAGSGKTTLARYVVESIVKDKDNPFNNICHINMSKKLSLNDIYCDILKVNNVDQDRQRLQEDLRRKLEGKRFLFVLDDLWVNKNHELDELLSSLNVGASRSKILVTFRREDEARFQCVGKTIAISDLNQDQYLEMFMDYALGDTVINDQEWQKYVNIGKRIVAKLQRSPLAAALVGGQLRMNKNIHFWSTLAELNVLNETREVIWWSYQQLDVDIRRCFEYCSIFPRSSELEANELARMWVAQGFVSATEGMEDIANTYIHDLVACSFLQVTRSSATTVYYTMHDLLRDLVEEVSGRDYFRVENDFTGKVPKDVIHLFMETYDGSMLAQQIVKLKRLRTIIIGTVRSETPIEEIVFEHMFRSLPKLRVLAVRHIKLQGEALFSTFSFPACISHSKHLRYVVLSTGAGMKIILPSTLSELYHMQLLDFGYCTQLEFSGGEDTTNLINLRHIKSSAARYFPNIGRITSLQTLSVFTVFDDPGYRLDQLKDLNKLQGKLLIQKLENVKRKEDAVEANLAAKKRLKDLTLSGNYSESSSSEATAQVVDGLCPPELLETLRIWGTNALRCPSWMSGPYLKHLNALFLRICSWQTLPENMEQYFTSLMFLHIMECANIRSLPNLPRSLIYIQIILCDKEFMQSCQEPGDDNWEKVQHIPVKVIGQERSFELDFLTGLTQEKLSLLFSHLSHIH